MSTPGLDDPARACSRASWIGWAAFLPADGRTTIAAEVKIRNTSLTTLPKANIPPP